MDMDETTYYAISAIGWARGKSPAEAHEGHAEQAIIARPSWIKPTNWLRKLLAPECQPNIYRAPEYASGFILQGSTPAWTDESGNRLREVYPEEVIYSMPFE